MSKLLRNGIPRTEDGKIDYSWKNHYGFTGLIVLLGFLFPPLAVAVRFGIGKDFFINVLLTLCAIIPGHIHNWFIQNIRNNDTKTRTPKWAIRYGLVDDRATKKLAKSRAWTGRFNDQLPPSQRVVYDDEGNAHVVDEIETREDGITAPWNVHAVGGVSQHKTGLVEPDQWINHEPDSSFDYTHIESHQQQPKPSKLARFRSSKHETSAWSANDTSPSNARRSSLSSTTSSLSITTPEDPTRSTFTRNSRAADSRVVASNRKENDIFSHQF